MKEIDELIAEVGAEGFDVSTLPGKLTDLGVILDKQTNDSTQNYNKLQEQNKTLEETIKTKDTKIETLQDKLYNYLVKDTGEAKPKPKKSIGLKY